jgi:hypothetical protein
VITLKLRTIFRGPYSFVIVLLASALTAPSLAENDVPKRPLLEEPNQLIKFRSDIATENPKGVEDFSKALEKLGLFHRVNPKDDRSEFGFVLGNSSRSNQIGPRAIGYADPSLIVSVGDSDSIEIAVHSGDGRGTLPYLAHKESSTSKFKILPSKDCASCHGEQFTYIWGPYLAWDQGFQNEDKPFDSKLFQSARAHPHLKALFKSEEAKSNPNFPYDLEKYGANLPETTLGQFLIRLSIKNILEKAKALPSKKFRKFGPTLLFSLICGESAQLPSLSEARQIFEKNHPGALKGLEEASQTPEWKNGSKFSDPGHLAALDALVLLSLLGTDPHQILLSKPLDGNEFLFTKMRDFVKQQASDASSYTRRGARFGNSASIFAAGLFYWDGASAFSDYLAGSLTRELAALDVIPKEFAKRLVDEYSKPFSQSFNLSSLRASTFELTDALAPRGDGPLGYRKYQEAVVSESPNPKDWYRFGPCAELEVFATKAFREPLTTGTSDAASTGVNSSHQEK